MTRAGQLAQGTATTVVALAATQALTAIAMLVLARRMGAEEFGAFAVVYTASIALAALADFGSSQRKVRELSADHELDSFADWLLKRTKAQAAVLVPVILVTSAILSAAGVFDTWGQRIGYPLLALQSLCWTFGQGSLTLVRAEVSQTAAVLCIGVGNIGLLVGVLLAPPAVLFPVAAGCAAGSWIVSALVGRRLTPSRGDKSTPNVWVGNPWAGSLAFGMASSALALQQFDLAAFRIVAGAADVGVVAAVSRWTQPLLLIVNGYTGNLYLYLSRARDDREAYGLLRTAWLPLTIVGAGAAAACFSAPFLVSTLLGDGYEGAATVLRIFAVGSIGYAISQILLAYLQARRDERYAATVIILSTACYLLLTLLFGGQVGPPGVPLAWGATFVVSALLLTARIVSKRPVKGGGIASETEPATA